MVLRQDNGYTAEPKAARRKREKGHPDDLLQPANIMFDRRVVRGNTYAAQILPAEAPTLSPASPVKQRRRKPAARKPATPPPVHGRQHIELQTDAYLEELADVVPDKNADTQTDAFLDRPVTPLFMQQKRGVDAETQIENGDLFDFNMEVEPLLEVLVGKTLEQGLMEVLEEEELAAMRAHQEHFEHIRNAELVATQKLEQAERRKVEEKERRLQEAKERVEREKVVREKIAASIFARGFLTGMVDSVMDSLWQKGHFRDPVEVAVKQTFLPWLQTAAHSALERRRDALAVISSLVTDATAALESKQRKRSEQQQQCRQIEESHKEALASEHEALAKAEQEAVEGRASHLLTNVLPLVIATAKIDSMREELGGKADAAVNTKWEELKEQAGTEAREKAEAQAAEAADAVAAADAEEGAEPAEAAPAVDVEAIVAEAVSQVEKPSVQEVTDTDILNALLEADPALKDSIVSMLAVQELGSSSWVHDERFASDLEPPAAVE